MILMIDNYDSFTFNLVQYLGELGETVRVFRNNCVTIHEIQELKPKAIFISPGPGVPEAAGISSEVINTFSGIIPIFGVCLGHQAIGQVFGAEVVCAETLMHGKTSEIWHDGKGIYHQLKNPFVATRYHSLIVSKETLPECLEITAQTEQGEIMGLRHRDYLVEGVQFHPESIMTEMGKELIQKFLVLAEKYEIS